MPATALQAAEVTAGAGEPVWSAGVMAGAGVRSNLLDMLPHLVEGKMDIQRDRMSGVLLRRGLGHCLPTAGASVLDNWGWSCSTELSLTQHSGLSDVTEVGLVWRPSVRLVERGPLWVEVAWGLGFSHTFGQPTYDGAGLPDGSRLYPNLFHMTPELVIRPSAAPAWGLGLRVHHRSGIYGVIAPRKAGSNHGLLTLTRDF